MVGGEGVSTTQAGGALQRPWDEWLQGLGQARGSFLAPTQLWSQTWILPVPARLSLAG